MPFCDLDNGGRFNLTDEAFDYWSVGFGFYLYDLFVDDLDSLTEEAFTNALDDYIDEYGEPPVPDNA